MVFFEHERTRCFQRALQSHLEEVLLLMLRQKGEELMGYQLRESLLPSLI